MEAIAEQSLEVMESSIVNPFYEVGRAPLYADLKKDGQVHKVDSGLDSLINVDTQKQVGWVSRKYNLVTNREVADMLDEAFVDTSVFSVKDHLNLNQGSWVRQVIFDADNMTFDVTGRGDIVKVMAELVNSYNGQSSLELRIKMWRQICSNGMMGWKNLTTLRFKHLIDNLIDKMRDLFSLNIGQLTAETQRWGEWSQIAYPQHKFNDFIDMHLIPATDEEANKKSLVPRILSDRQADYVKAHYEPVMNEYGDEETKWGAFNVLTGITSHHIKTRKVNASPLFTAAYDRMEKLLYSFYNQPADLN